MPKITKRVVDALRPERSGDVFRWDAGDGALKGFGIRMKPSGTASYLVQYRNKEGRTRRLVIGKVGTLTPDEARALAADALRAASKGGDPSAERHAVRGAITVSGLCDLYLADAKNRIKASTLAMDRSRIEAHVKPLIGRFTVRGLTTPDIERMKADIIGGKTAKPRQPRGRGGITTGGAGAAARIPHLDRVPSRAAVVYESLQGWESMRALLTASIIQYSGARAIACQIPHRVAL